MHPLVFKVPTELPRNGASFGHDTRVWGPQSMALMGQGGSSPWFVRELKQFWTMIALSKNKTSTVLLVMWRWVESFFWYLKTGRWHIQKMNRSCPIFYRTLCFTHRKCRCHLSSFMNICTRRKRRILASLFLLFVLFLLGKVQHYTMRGYPLCL